MSTTGTGQARKPASHTRKPRSAGLGSAVRVLSRRVHFLAGVLVAPLLVVLCLTGLLYVFSPQIHDGLYRSQLYVQEVNGQPRPVSEQVEAALTAHPEAEVQAVRPPPAPDRTTRIMLSVPGLDNSGEARTARTVFVDPYTNYINGELTTVADQLPANTWLRDLHSNLQLGDAGRLYSELATSWLPFIVLGGVALWLLQPGRRRRLRELLVPAARGRGTWMRLRAVKGPLGVWLVIGLLAVGITGLTMSRFTGGRDDQAVNPLDARTPLLAVAPVDVPENDRRIGIDQALAVAAAEQMRGEVVVTVPRAADQPFTVTEKSAGLPVERDTIAIHPYTGEVTERLDWTEWPFLAKAATLGVEFHTGALFGLGNQIIVALLATGTLVLVVLSYAMWWKRSPYAGKWAALPAPAWRQLPRTVLALVAVAAAALGWLLPVFGVSLVGFVAVDAVINAIRQHRLERFRAHPAVAAASAVLLASSVLAVSLLWPSGARDERGSLPAPPQPQPRAPGETREPTPGEPAASGTPTPEPVRSGAEPVSRTPRPDTTWPSRDPGEPEPTGEPGPLPTEGSPTSWPGPSPTQSPTRSPTRSPTPWPTPSPSPTGPTPSPSPSPPPNPPPGELPCTIQIGGLCVVDLGVIIDLGW